MSVTFPSSMRIPETEAPYATPTAQLLLLATAEIRPAHLRVERVRGREDRERGRWGERGRKEREGGDGGGREGGKEEREKKGGKKREREGGREVEEKGVMILSESAFLFNHIMYSWR